MKRRGRPPSNTVKPDRDLWLVVLSMPGAPRDVRSFNTEADAASWIFRLHGVGKGPWARKIAPSTK